MAARYEAERAHCSGWAIIKECGQAESGAVVGNIGGTNTDIGSAVFDVYAPSDGVYNVRVAYISENESYFFVRANDNTAVKIVTVADDEPRTAKVECALNAGCNLIKIYSTKGIVGGVDYRIAVDYIELDTVPDEPSAALGVYDAQLFGTAYLRRAYKSESGYVIAGLGRGGAAEFTVECKEREYLLEIWYSAWNYRALEICVDGELRDTVYCPITGETENVSALAVRLQLRAGRHTLAFSCEFAEAPDIAGIRLVEAGEYRAAAGKSVGKIDFGNGKFCIRYDLAAGKADYIVGEHTRLAGFEAAAKLDARFSAPNGKSIDGVVKSSDYTARSVEYSELNDGFGHGVLAVVINEAEGSPTLVQKFYIYDDLSYALISAELVSDAEIETSFIAPVSAAGAEVLDIGEKSDARALFVPFSNDNYYAYNAERLGGAHISHFVTAVFDNVSRNAVICGAVEHDTWKSGTSVWSAEGNGAVSFFGAFGGIWSREFTYDFQPHGSIIGTRLSSPKMLLGFFDDWRDGLEEYGRANVITSGRLEWNGGAVFGFNSWNSIRTDYSFDRMVTATDEIARLRDMGFCDENGGAWLNSDAFFERIEEVPASDGEGDRLDELIRYINGAGLGAGVYTSNYIIWDNDLTSRGERDNVPVDKYGFPVTIAKFEGGYGAVINSIGIDPTTDKTKEKIGALMRRHAGRGFKFIKADFLAFSAIEGKFHNPAVRTGMQAYNAVCREIAESVDTNELFISYSIAPLFPSQYAHSRRICCDTDYESAPDYMARAKYMLNSLQYGWWQSGSVYRFGDPDQVSFDENMPFDERAVEIARGKYTSCIIAGGVTLLSNNYDKENVRKITETVVTNAEVNEIARIGKAFRPCRATEPWEAPYMRNLRDPENVYSMVHEGTAYIAVFNFADEVRTVSFKLSELGLYGSRQMRELWTGEEFCAEGDEVSAAIPAFGARIYRTQI